SAEDPTVVVVRGDSLWDLPHLELGADATVIQIDRRWRQWGDHNQDIIGDDAHTLVPGTVRNAAPRAEYISLTEQQAQATHTQRGKPRQLHFPNQFTPIHMNNRVDSSMQSGTSVPFQAQH